MTLAPTPSNESSEPGCQDPQIPTITWVLLGLFLSLAFFSRLITILLFKAFSGALKSLKATSFDEPFRTRFRNPVAILLCLLFLELAWQVAPWLCFLSWLKNIVGFLLLASSLVVLLILIGRIFDFAEIFLKYFNIDPFYVTAFREGIRVAKLITIFFVGLLFFSIVVLRIDPHNQFRVELFFSAANFISLSYILFFVPVARDALGGVILVADRPFHMQDWVEIEGTRGTVERVGLFAVMIRTVNGGMTMIANSRFVENSYIVYPALRKRVASVKYPLPCNYQDMPEVARRALIAKVERELKAIGVSDIMVTFNMKGSDVNCLDIRFVTDKVSMVEQQVTAFNSALAKIAASFRT